VGEVYQASEAPKALRRTKSAMGRERGEVGFGVFYP